MSHSHIFRDEMNTESGIKFMCDEFQSDIPGLLHHGNNNNFDKATEIQRHLKGFKCM